MLVTDSWTKVTNFSGTGGHIQKHGLLPVQVAYAETESSIGSFYVIRDNEKQVLHDTLEGDFIWLRAPVEDTDVTLTESDHTYDGVTIAREMFTVELDLDATQDVAILVCDERRNFLAISHDENKRDVRVWIGPHTPPIDKKQWMPIKDNIFQLGAGCAGPIYVGEADDKDLQVFILSAIDETSTASVVPLAQVSNLPNL